MKNKISNQEILLMQDTSFFKHDWCEKATNARTKKLSQKDLVIQLCWDGMLPQLLPEINETLNGEKPLTLWELTETGNMLDLRLGDFNQSMNDEWSINPYVCMLTKIWN